MIRPLKSHFIATYLLLSFSDFIGNAVAKCGDFSTDICDKAGGFANGGANQEALNLYHFVVLAMVVIAYLLFIFRRSVFKSRQEDNSKIDQMLSRYPGHLVLNCSRKKWLWMCFVSCLCVAACVWTIHDIPWIAWLGIILCGVTSLLSAAMLLPHAGSLVLDNDGFRCTTLWRQFSSRWRDVTDFKAYSFGRDRNTAVGYFDTQFKGQKLAEFEMKAFGCNAALPDNYGFCTEELARLMTEWRNRAMPAQNR